jgi:hypothetical protein
VTPPELQVGNRQSLVDRSVGSDRENHPEAGSRAVRRH